MNEPPFITLITPVYNIAKLISATIESALIQTFKDWEMICVIDGSPDNAGDICDLFAARDPRIRVVRKENAGLAAARNTGLQQARGKYFWIYEGSDLFFDENTLSTVHSMLEANPVDILFARLQDKMEKNAEITSMQKKYCVDGLWNDGGANLVCKLYDCNDILALSSPVNKVFRTEYILNNALWFCEGIYHDDDEWIPKAVAHAETAYFTDIIIYNALTWDGCFGGNVSEKALRKKAVDKMFLAQKCCEYFQEKFVEHERLRKKMNTYYLHFYQEGMLAHWQIKDPALRNEVWNAAHKHKGILRYGDCCESFNVRLFAMIGRMLGLNIAEMLLRMRYGK